MPPRRSVGAMAAVAWVVYVLHSRRAARTYVGIARDVERRLAQHNGRARGGARATRAGRPWKLRRVFGPYATRSEAQVVEARVKRLRGRARLLRRPEDPPEIPVTPRRRARPRRTAL